MSRHIITLTTDFGTGSSYVAQMKGVILSMNPDVNIIDVSHTIPAQDVRQGAIVLAEVVNVFPSDAIHVAVVDPGVGTDRNIAYVRMAEQHFIAPDNGVLSLVAKKYPPSAQMIVSNPEYWRDEVSATFHGRDIMAPVAAHLSLGIDPAKLGDDAESLVRLSLPSVHVDSHEIRGAVVSFDSFGNLITDITGSMLEEPKGSESFSIRCGNHVVSQLSRTYGENIPLTLVALIGSSGLLELAIVNGNAAQRLGIEVGSEVTVTW